MPLILDGTIVRSHHIQELKKKVERLSIKPSLVIFRVGDDSRSDIYIREKKRRGESAGVTVAIISLTEVVSTEDVVSLIREKNSDNSVHGIIVQLPLPAHLEKEKIIEAIDPKKDVDGLTKINQGKLSQGDTSGLIPATARGILSLLSFYNVPVSQKKIAVLGRSALVGWPTAKLLELSGGIVTVCHSKTDNTREITKNSDVIIVAIGKPELIDASYIGTSKPVVIDVGINPSSGETLLPGGGRSIVGDVKFEEVARLTSAISPVPGGVGPMTVVSLLENVFLSACDMLARLESNKLNN